MRKMLIHESDLFKCDNCGKEFSRKFNLKTHMSIHESNPHLKNQFNCVCGSSFTQKGNLKKHVSMHEVDPNLKYRFNCDICEKKFARKSYVMMHMVIHESSEDLKYRFNCDICKKKFARKGNLKIHMLIHESNPECTTIFEQRRQRDVKNLYPRTKTLPIDPIEKIDESNQTPTYASKLRFVSEFVNCIDDLIIMGWKSSQLYTLC